ncbi:SRPBCC domain-containing protein [Bradyrhizobium sp. LHD-71]|uniref:SRPBCC family protein n=1 Tax=Bradyrhizobium sp. LHD-71 TaxID=3072141 RepID=UPI00280DE301|nr:SRPBCC domain-containing protein [Bradyrhizobium sp. LHD-71]MDQ8728891.1 SRPBCC domain-containing protein [Bradyrhizobium sp. LHD-71]
MNEIKADAKTQDLVLEYELDAPPEKVWRAISIPAFRDKWLPTEALASAEPVALAPGEEIRYSIREDEPPFLESVVTFQVKPNAEGGTHLRIIHRLMGARRVPQAANSNWPCLMRAA